MGDEDDDDGAGPPQEGGWRAELARAAQPDGLRGWHIYFPNDPFAHYLEHKNELRVFDNFFRVNRETTIATEECERTNAVRIEYQFLIDSFRETYDDFAKDFAERPATMLSLLGLAAYNVRCFYADDGAAGDDMPKLFVRIINFDAPTPMRKIKSSFIGRFVCVRGTVVRVSNVKPLVTHMEFSCVRCEGTQEVAFVDGKYALPTRCTTPQCRGKTFSPIRGSPNTKTIDWQTIRVQEILADDDRESGRVPRTIDCEVVCDLVDACVPGDVVVVCGEVKVAASDEGATGRNKPAQAMFVLYIAANSVQNPKKTAASISASAATEAMMTDELSMRDLYAIQSIQNEKDLFRVIVNSICPAIYGHELVKAGLALSLFGGVQRYADARNKVPIRGDPHVLVVGDPGLGKSQMLQALTGLAPRGVYVCGNTATTAGLTVALAREGGSGDYALEAGALVLGDQGICCIDEFDKMTADHQALLEAMEQQSISIAKAGIVCSLPARTSVIAAANPVGGHYNKAKTVAENLKLNSALLSRFDLVFILLDRPDEDMDRLLSDHVMAMHAGKVASARAARANAMRVASQHESQARREWMADQPLAERLKPNIGADGQSDIDHIPPALIRKYVGYARSYVHPRLAPEAADELRTFYLSLRRDHQSQDSTPITTRQLESLVRLAEARARLELRETVTVDDARDVIEIFRFSLFDTFSDDMGNLDFQRSQNGSGLSRKAIVKRFVGALTEHSRRHNTTLFSRSDLKEIGSRLGVLVDDDMLESLSHGGYLLNKGARTYQLQTAG